MQLLTPMTLFGRIGPRLGVAMRTGVRVLSVTLMAGSAFGCAEPGLVANAPAPPFAEVECSGDETDPSRRCGSVPVFEDRATGQGRKIDVRVVVLEATGEERQEPLFVLLGGPGQGAADFAVQMAGGYEKIRESRDVVFVDQRGTGASNPLDCELPADPSVAFEGVFPRELIRRCRAELEERADLSKYTSSAFADDLNDVRRALGYERIYLSGGSYGTRAALVYTRRHPESVRGLILDGVFPPGIHAALPYARTADDSLRRLFADCEADAACSSAFPDLEERFDRLMERYDEPIEAEIDLPDGSTASVPVSRGVFGYGLRGIQYGRGIWSLPPTLAAAESGDVGPVAQAYYGRALAIWDAVSVGLHLSVFCAEDLPFVEPDEVGPMTADTYLGEYLFAEYAEACDLWIRGDVPGAVHEPVRSEVPVLMYSGRRDPITPPRLAQEAARTLPNTLHVVFPAGGHGYPGGDGGGCKGRISDQFLRLGTIEGVDTSCADEIVPAGFNLPDAE